MTDEKWARLTNSKHWPEFCKWCSDHFIVLNRETVLNKDIALHMSAFLTGVVFGLRFSKEK